MMGAWFDQKTAPSAHEMRSRLVFGCIHSKGVFAGRPELDTRRRVPLEADQHCDTAPDGRYDTLTGHPNGAYRGWALRSTTGFGRPKTSSTRVRADVAPSRRLIAPTRPQLGAESVTIGAESVPVGPESAPNCAESAPNWSRLESKWEPTRRQRQPTRANGSRVGCLLGAESAPIWSRVGHRVRAESVAYWQPTRLQFWAESVAYWEPTRHRVGNRVGADVSPTRDPSPGPSRRKMRRFGKMRSTKMRRLGGATLPVGATLLVGDLPTKIRKPRSSPQKGVNYLNPLGTHIKPN